MTAYRYYGWVNEAAARRWTPAVRAFLLLMIGVFVVRVILPESRYIHFQMLFGLSWEGIMRGGLWQPITYIFLHGGLLHVVLNALVLYFIGPATERTIGTRQFAILFLLSGVLGGIGWLLMDMGRGICIGASGAVFGVIGAFAALYPQAPLTVFVFYLVPVTLPAWVWAVLFAVGELIAMLRHEAGGIAYAAHLAGGIAGYVYSSVVFCHAEPFRTWFHRLSRKCNATAWFTSPPPTPMEIDRILEKVARSGLQSLTAEERAALERAAEERRRRGY